MFSCRLAKSRIWGLGVLQVGVLAGSRAPLSVQAVVCFTLPNFSRVWRGAKVLKSYGSRKILQNEDLLAKIGVDTAKNEPYVEV